MWTMLLILAAVLATSVLSGVLGMAGGIILMAMLVAMLSVSAAMVVHGIVQGSANGSRAFFLRRYIVWRVMPPYVAGAAVALASFIAVGVLPETSWVLIVIGTFPFVARLAPRMRGLDVTGPTTAAFCGVIVTGAQPFAGASGPLLDVFYLTAPLNRHQIVPSKAFTQTLGHVLKLVYYGGIIGVDQPLSPYFRGGAIAIAVLGTRLGTRMIDRFDDAGFRRTSGYVIMGIGAYCIAQGAWGVVTGP